MLNVSCPSCDNQNINSIDFFKEYRSPVNRRLYKAYHCRQCDLEFWFPRKLKRELYEDDVFDGYESAHENFEGPSELCGWFDTDRWFKDYVSFKSGRLLDVGCSNGIFLSRIKTPDLSIYGIDFDEKSIEAGKKRGLKNLFAVSLEEFIKQNGESHLKFDVITFFEVLEHQSNPSNFIEDIRSILKVGGFIVGTVPNRNRMFVRLYRAGSLADYPPHHFLWWSKTSLGIFFSAHGFDNLEFISVNPRSFQYLVFGGFSKAFFTAMGSIIDRNGHMKFIRKHINLPNNRKSLLSKILNSVLDIIFLPFSILSFLLIMVKPEKIFFKARLKK